MAWKSVNKSIKDVSVIDIETWYRYLTRKNKKDNGNHDYDITREESSDRNRKSNTNTQDQRRKEMPPYRDKHENAYNDRREEPNIPGRQPNQERERSYPHETFNGEYSSENSETEEEEYYYDKREMIRRERE